MCLFVDAGEGISTHRRQFGLIRRDATLQQYSVDIVDSRDKKKCYLRKAQYEEQ